MHSSEPIISFLSICKFSLSVVWIFCLDSEGKDIPCSKVEVFSSTDAAVFLLYPYTKFLVASVEWPVMSDYLRFANPEVQFQFQFELYYWSCTFK